MQALRKEKLLMVSDLSNRLKRPSGWNFTIDANKPIPPQRNAAEVIGVNHAIIHTEENGSHSLSLISVLVRHWHEFRAPTKRALEKTRGAFGAGAETMSQDHQIKSAKDLQRRDGAKLSEQLSAVLEQELRNPPSFEEIQRRIKAFEERQERTWASRTIKY